MGLEVGSVPATWAGGLQLTIFLLLRFMDDKSMPFVLCEAIVAFCLKPGLSMVHINGDQWFCSSENEKSSSRSY